LIGNTAGLPIDIGFSKPKDSPTHCLKSAGLKLITFSIFLDLCGPIYGIMACGELRKLAAQIAAMPKSPSQNTANRCLVNTISGWPANSV
jgi:hypothetical protein